MLAILFLIPQTARLAALLIAVWMIGPILSHIFVLGYGGIFVNAVATFILPCFYLYLTRTQSNAVRQSASGSFMSFGRERVYLLPFYLGVPAAFQSMILTSFHWFFRS